MTTKYTFANYDNLPAEMKELSGEKDWMSFSYIDLRRQFRDLNLGVTVRPENWVRNDGSHYELWTQRILYYPDPEDTENNIEVATQVFFWVECPDGTVEIANSKSELKKFGYERRGRNHPPYGYTI